MKKILLLSLCLTLFSCADNKIIDGIEYRPYGLLNESRCKNNDIHYEIAIDATFSGIFFSELLFIPTVYVFGYNWYEPICKKSDFKNGMDSIVN